MKKLCSFCVSAVALALMTWMLAPQGSARAQAPSGERVTLPTAPDFYIQDWPPDPSYGTLSEMHADVAYNSVDDLFMVVFDWDFHGGDARDVMFVRVHSDGAIDPMPFEVVEDAAWDDANPAVAYNPDDDNYLVVWERRDATGVAQLFGAIVDGTSVGTPFYIAVGGADHLAPDVAYSSAAGRYLVVWEDHNIGWVGPPDIVGASADGTGGNRQTLHIAPEPNVGTSEQRRPAVTAHGTLPRWLVTWEDSRTAATTGIDIYGQQVAFDGSTLSLPDGQFPIGAQTGEAAAPAVAWGPVGLADGEYLTVWTENSWIFGQRVSADSTLAGGAITISSGVADAKTDPAVVYAPAADAWWVVWAEHG
jgi:hypothetical protein